MIKVMIVEDDEGIRQSISRLLVTKGYTTIEWPGTTGAEKMINLMHPDMILTDNDLGPGEEKGLDMATRLKEKGLRVMLMSGDPSIKISAEERGLPFYFKLDPLPDLFSKLREVCHV